MALSTVKKNIVANYFGGGWAALMNIAFVPLYIKYLGIEAFGLIGVFATLQAIIVLIDFGFTPTITREFAKYCGGQTSTQSIRELMKSLEVMFLIVSILLIILAILLADVIASKWLEFESLAEAEVINALRIMMVIVILRWLSTLYRGAIIGLQRQVWLNGSNIVFSTLRGPGVVLALIYLSATIEVFFIYQGCIYIFESIILKMKVNSVIPKCKDVRISLQPLSAISKFAFGIAGINALAVLLTQADKLIISAYLPLSSLGYYTLAGSIAGALYQLVSPLTNAAYPRLTEAFSKKQFDMLHKIYTSLSQMLAVIIIPFSCVLSMFSSHILLLWTRDYEITENVSQLLSILSLGFMLNGIMTLPYVYQLSVGWTRFGLIANIIAVLTYIPMVFVGVKILGVIGPALAWLLLNFCTLVIGVPLMHKYLKLEGASNWLFGTIFFPFLVSLFSTILIRQFIPEPSLEDGAKIIIYLAICLAISVLFSAFSTPYGISRIKRYFVKDELDN